MSPACTSSNKKKAELGYDTNSASIDYLSLSLLLDHYLKGLVDIFRADV